MLRGFLMLAAFFGFTGVALGAFAAHGLKNRLTPEYLAIFHTGVTYQLVHTLALLGVALLATQIPGRLITWAGASFAIGILLFSGSLYLLTLTGVSKLGHHHPLRRPGIPGRLVLPGPCRLALAADRLTLVA